VCIQGRKLGHGGNVPEARIDIQTRHHRPSTLLPLSSSLCLWRSHSLSPSLSLSLFLSLFASIFALLFFPVPRVLFIFLFCHLPHRQEVNGPSGCPPLSRGPDLPSLEASSLVRFVLMERSRKIDVRLMERCTRIRATPSITKCRFHAVRLRRY